MVFPGRALMENEGFRVPLAERMRPRDVNEMVGQPHLLGPGSPVDRALTSGHLFSVILWGPPGSGKTTLARLMGKCTHLPFRAFSAVTSGLADLKQVIAEAQKTRQETGNPTLLFVDEIHRFNKAQQDAFLPHVESGLIILVGATTQNPSFEVIPPLLSRTRVMTLNRLGREDILSLLTKALSDEERGLGALRVEVEPKGLEFLADLSQGDARVALNDLEAAVTYAMAADASGPEQHPFVDLKTLETALSKKALPYDKDGEEHYNVISAFHKSLRGGDPQAALYWLYRMLLSGEDPRFICRRMVRFASEDVGLADPHALTMAVSAFEAWDRIGPPEGELALAEAAVYLASAPKSNALYLAEKAVKQEIDQTGPRPVPFHIRNAPTGLMKRAGYGRGYLYPHNYPGGWVEQAYLPDGLRNHSYYRPTDRGFEKEVRRRLERWKKK
jgi:putative ATPase